MKERTVVYIPDRQPELENNKVMPVSITLEGFKKNDNRANFLFVYTKESHPKGGWEVDRNKQEDVDVVQASDLAERSKQAKRMHEALRFNWPMLVEVSGLPQQAQQSSYYELWLTHNGKAVALCGSFRVHGKTTRVRLTVPYALKNFDGWVVTSQGPDRNGLGPVVLTT